MLSSVFSVSGKAAGLAAAVLVVVILASDVPASTIAGFVYDEQRNPIVELDLELLNENYVMRQRVKTNGVGRYQFDNVVDGRYYVKALPFRYNLEDQTQEVIVDSFDLNGHGITNVERDFYLRRKSGGLGETTSSVVFVQEVPEDAERLYKNGVEALKSNKITEGLTNLIGAVNEFPMYFAACQRLGLELLRTKQFVDAAKMFMRAAEINPTSSISFYYMGVSLNLIGKEYNRAALLALEKARLLASSSFEVSFLIGKIQRQEGNLLEAEKALLTAKKLANTKVPEIHIELAQLYGNDLKQFGKAADELELYLKASNKKDEKIDKLINNLRAKAKGPR